MQFDRVWIGGRLATMRADRAGLGVIEDGAIATAGGPIAYVGPTAALPSHAAPVVALDGRWVNPGSSPLSSLLLAMNFACVLFGLTVDEAMLGVTRHAATALGRGQDIGTLETGKRCDLAIWSVERLAELPYRMGARPLHARVFGGA